MPKLIRNKAILDLLDYYKLIHSISHLRSLAGWDLNTYMPEAGAEERGEALAKTGTLVQSLILSREFKSKLRKAESQDKLNSYEQGIIRMLKRSLKHYTSLPKKFIEELIRVETLAHHAWKEAKEKSDFSIFAPHLEKIVSLSIKKAEYLGYKSHPYDALLDEYEEGLTTSQVELFFSEIKYPLISLLNSLKKSNKYSFKSNLESQKYSIEKAKITNEKILSLLKADKRKLRLDISPHPFSSGLGIGDGRITTRYEGTDIKRTISSVIHEFGHALYDLQSHPELKSTPILGGSSLIIHESQSRFWEKLIGQRAIFSRRILAILKEDHPQFSNVEFEEFYKYFNTVKQSPIRVDADELTYHFHIMIRFEIEKALIEGKIKVSELPRIWAEKYQEYLGITPKNDSEGVLQDVHWSCASIGYFPTYSIGTALSACWLELIEKDLGSLNKVLASDDGIEKIQSWLKENIHKYGSTYTLNDLLALHKMKLTPAPLLNYLENKYRRIYNNNL